MKTKVIVVTGGVYSSLGKGIVASSIGCILKHGNFKIAMLKLDPYLNTDPGLLSPMQHGEVFITTDGQKTDLDLGHYERFTGLNLNKSSTQTGGRLYTEILNDEKQIKYKGATIQVIPHFTNKIIEKINYAIKQNDHPDFLIIEIGGTIGDIESLAFIEATRLYNAKYKNVLFVHCSPLFKLNANDEIKTKPTQHSVKTLRNLGINPSILILRFNDLISESEKNKLSWTCDITKNNIFVSKDCKYLYEVPKILFEQGIQDSIMKFFRIKNSYFDMSDWYSFLDSIYQTKTKTINVCICGQYTKLNDSYLSIIESLKIASWKQKIDLNFTLLNCDELTNNNYQEKLKTFDGFIIPDGYNKTDVINKLTLVVKNAINNQKPLIGIKLGLQAIINNFFNHKNLYKKINNLNDYLGSKKINIVKPSKFYDIYKKDETYERFWNHWKINDTIFKQLNNNILKPSVLNEQNEIAGIEYENNPCLIGTLFNPEYLSKPNEPHPIFTYFINKLSK